MIAAVDMEAYYDSDISVVTMGAWRYARATDIYLVSIAADNGLRYVGDPKDAPWAEIDGAVWVMHNAAFDMTLFERLKENGTVPKDIGPRNNGVFDTADLAAYLGFPRSLKEAAKHLLGAEITKSTRDSMKGLRWN